MPVREWLGFALVSVGVILAPVAIIRGGIWWVAVVAVIVAGIVTFMSRRVADEEQRNRPADDSGGLGLAPHRPASVGGRAAAERSEMSDGGTADADGD